MVDTERGKSDQYAAFQGKSRFKGMGTGFTKVIKVCHAYHNNKRTSQNSFYLSLSARQCEKIVETELTGRVRCSAMKSSSNAL